jgi:hypothetical protein
MHAVQDTTTEAERIQAEVHRRLGGARTFQIACEMSDAVREMARARIRARHSGCDEHVVEAQVLWELYGFRRER